MKPKTSRTLLFVPDGDPRARSAEALFNAAAGRMGLAWRAASGPAPVPADYLVTFTGALTPAGDVRSETWMTAAADLEPAIADLIARLLGGGPRPDVPPPPQPARPKEVVKKPPVVKVGRETAGRRGKGVTVVTDVPLDAAGLAALAATLKQRCGTGGTVKDGRIEIQGDQRERIIAELESLGYRAKRAGG